MRIVLDACVLAKMVFFGDTWAKEVLTLARNSFVHIVSCTEIENDWGSGFCQVYMRVLKSRNLNTLHQFAQSAKCMIEICELAEMTTLGVIAPYSIDPGDNKYVQCAVDGNAKYIITYDGDHLIALSDKIQNAKNEIIRIMSPYQFINEYKLLNSKFKIGSLRK